MPQAGHRRSKVTSTHSLGGQQFVVLQDEVLHFLAHTCNIESLHKNTSSYLTVREFSIYLSISPTPHPPPGTSLKGVAIAEKSSSFLVLAFPHCVVKASPVISLPTVLVHCVYPFYWWLPSHTGPFNFTLVHSLNKLILIHSYHVSKPPQCTTLYSFNNSTIYSLCCCTQAKFLIHIHIALSIPS